jgi:tetratricopeptide (TPR) repeat protein
MKQLLFFFLSLVSFSLFGQSTDRQFPTTSASPEGKISQVIGNTQIQIEYERPLARKRQIFGDLVPWNKVWRTGAGRCTRIMFNKPVVVGGQKIAAGHYSLFTIPNPQRWIIILNSDTSLYGSYGYDVAKDIARFDVTPATTNRHYEALTIDVDLVQSNARIYISWLNTQVGFAVQTSTASEAKKFIEQELLTGKNKNSDAYFEAAQFLLFEKEDLEQALKLADKAIQLNKENGAARRVKIEIYEFLHQYPEALNEIKLALEMEKSKRYEKEEERKLEMNYWQRFHDRIKAKQNLQHGS